MIRTVFCNHGTVTEQDDLIQNWALCNCHVDYHVLEQNNDTRSILLLLSLTDSLRGKRTLKISRVSLVAVTMWTEASIAWAISVTVISLPRNFSLMNLRAVGVPTAAMESKIHFLKVTTKTRLSEKAVWSLLFFLKIGFKSPVSRFFPALGPEWFQVLNVGWTEKLDHFKEVLRGVLMDPLHVVVDQVIKNLHNLKITIKGVLLKRIKSNWFQFSFTIRSDTWACKFLILTSCRGVSKSSLGNSYFRDPLLTYWALLAMIGVFWILTKESSCLEGKRKDWVR